MGVSVGVSVGGALLKCHLQERGRENSSGWCSLVCLWYKSKWEHKRNQQRYDYLGRRFAAALLPQMFGKNPRSHHKGATGRVRTGDQLLPVLCHCQV